MFQLFKKRSFSSYINDTFDFFKVEGKNYFKNFFLINGAFLVLMLICSYFLFQVYFDFMKSEMQGFQQNYLTDYLEDNGLLIFLLAFAFMILLILFSAIAYSFPTLYLKNMEKYPGQNITTDMIVSDLKSQIGRILIYILGTVFIILPLIFILLGIGMVLIFIIIGIPLLLILFPAIMSVSMLSYNEYLIKGSAFFDSIAVGIKMVKNNFWPIIGSTFIMYFIIQIVASIFTFIPQMILMFNLLTGVKDDAEIFATDTFSVTYMIIMAISMIVGFILNNLLLVNQGLIYYSEREVMENNQSRFDIEQLGQSND